MKIALLVGRQTYCNHLHFIKHLTFITVMWIYTWVLVSKFCYRSGASDKISSESLKGGLERDLNKSSQNLVTEVPRYPNREKALDKICLDSESLWGEGLGIWIRIKAFKIWIQTGVGDSVSKQFGYRDPSVVGKVIWFLENNSDNLDPFVIT